MTTQPNATIGNALLDAALGYAARGWCIFPCHTPTPDGCSCRRDCGRIGKHPRTQHGLKDATTDEATIRHWWETWTQANIGIATGAVSGLVVLDEDTYKGGDSSRIALEQSYSSLPETVQQLTGGGGVQYFFAHPGTPVQNGVETLGAGLDIRGDGGYVIAPPSLHTSGKQYVWELSHYPDEMALAPMPPWLLALCQNTKRGEAVSAGDPIHKHHRNDTLFRLGCAMRARGFSAAVILAALREMNTTQCQPPLGDDEVGTIAESCAKYPEGTTHQDAPQRRNGHPNAARGLSSYTSSADTNNANPHKIRPNGLSSLSSLSSYSEWPTLAPDALYGLAGAIVNTIAPHSEADPIALLIQFLEYFGVIIGRSAYYQVEATKHYTNLNSCLVGPTAKGRKGTAYDHIEGIMQTVDTSWTLSNVSGGCGSGEGLIAAVRDKTMKREPIKVRGRVTGYEEVETDPGVIDKRLLVYEAEFSSVLKIAGREGNILSEILRKAWETGNLRNTVKNNPMKATGAHIAIIGHITIEEVQRTLTTTDAANGFGNRFLWLCVRRSQLLPDGGALHTVNFNPLLTRLREVFAKAKTIQQMRRDEAAKVAWHAVYPSLSEERPGLVGTLLARAEAQVLRLSMLYALLDGTNTIRAEHLYAALALWEYAEASVTYIFGKSMGDPVADILITSLQDYYPQGLSRKHILEETFHGNTRADELDRVLRLLQSRNLITLAEVPPEGGRGRPKQVVTYRPDELNELNELNRGGYLSTAKDAVKSVGLSSYTSTQENELNPAGLSSCPHRQITETVDMASPPPLDDEEPWPEESVASLPPTEAFDALYEVMLDAQEERQMRQYFPPPAQATDASPAEAQPSPVLGLPLNSSTSGQACPKCGANSWYQRLTYRLCQRCQYKDGLTPQEIREQQ